MKFKCIVEYEYPVEHKPPVKADIYLHGDKVTTREIKALQEELEKIKTEIVDIEEPDHDFEGFYYCLDKAIKILEKHIKEV